MKIGIDNGGNWTAEYYEATVVSVVDYYPFGSAMAGRKYNQGSYRYGFNGKEEDKEWGSQMIQDYGFRIYNPTIGKFLSVDPLTSSYPWFSPYQFAGNGPIFNIDLDGLENLDYLEFQKALINGGTIISKIEFINVENRLVTTKNSKWEHSGKKSIAVKDGKLPSDAVREFEISPQDFTMDCGTYCRAVLFTALLDVLEKDEFNERMNNETKRERNGKVNLRNHVSTGLRIDKQWMDIGKGLMGPDGKYVKSSKISKVLESVNIGSVINVESPFLKNIGSPYGNENIIKVGDNQYLAQGLGDGSPMTLEEIKNDLVQKGIDAGEVGGKKKYKKAAFNSIKVINIVEHTFEVTKNENSDEDK